MKESGEGERKKYKLINAKITVTVHKCIILHSLIWMFFGLKCVKRASFSILHNFTQADAVALSLVAVVILEILFLV